MAYNTKNRILNICLNIPKNLLVFQLLDVPDPPDFGTSKTSQSCFFHLFMNFFFFNETKTMSSSDLALCLPICSLYDMCISNHVMLRDHTLRHHEVVNKYEQRPSKSRHFQRNHMSNKLSSYLKFRISFSIGDCL